MYGLVVRVAAGVPGTEQLATRFKPTPTPADLDALAASSRPFVLATVGGIGLALIVWLMVSKPF